MEINELGLKKCINQSLNRCLDRFEAVEIDISKRIKKINPYLMAAIPTDTDTILRNNVITFLQRSLETIFGSLIEDIIEFVLNERDVEFSKKPNEAGGNADFIYKDGLGFTIYMPVKSSPYWGNSSQYASMNRDFAEFKKSHPDEKLKLVNFCAYGKEHGKNKKCGQRAWYFVSNGDNELYLKIIRCISSLKAESVCDRIENNLINKFIVEFKKYFCKEDEVLWEEVLKYNACPAYGNLNSLFQDKIF